MLAAAQRGGPRLDQQEPPVGVDRLAREAGEPSRRETGPARVDVVDPGAGDERPRLGVRAGLERMVDRLVRRARGGVPGGGAALQSGTSSGTRLASSSGAGAARGGGGSGTSWRRS